MADIKKVINKNVGAGLSPKELAILGASKVLTERATTHFLKQNGTWKSGLIKVVAGSMVGFSVKNKWVRLACAGVVLDGAEDISDHLYIMSKEKVSKTTVGQKLATGGASMVSNLTTSSNNGGLAPAF